MRKKEYLKKFLEKQKSKNEDDDKDKGSIGGEKSWNKYMQEKQKAGRKLKSVQEMMLIWNGTFKQDLGLCKKASIFLQAFLKIGFAKPFSLLTVPQFLRVPLLSFWICERPGLLPAFACIFNSRFLFHNIQVKVHDDTSGY